MRAKPFKASIRTRNEDWGFFGALVSGGFVSQEASKLFATMGARLQTLVPSFSDAVVTEALDSRWGRHLADWTGDSFFQTLDDDEQVLQLADSKGYARAIVSGKLDDKIKRHLNGLPRMVPSFSGLKWAATLGGKYFDMIRPLENLDVGDRVSLKIEGGRLWAGEVTSKISRGVAILRGRGGSFRLFRQAQFNEDPWVDVGIYVTDARNRGLNDLKEVLDMKVTPASGTGRTAAWRGGKLLKEIPLKNGDVIPKGTPVKLRFGGAGLTLPSKQVRLIADFVGPSGRDYTMNPMIGSIVNLAPKISRIKVPSLRQLQKWSDDGWCMTPTGYKVEPDGYGPDDSPSWMVALGYI
jgi:hypothetical protein